MRGSAGALRTGFVNILVQNSPMHSAHKHKGAKSQLTILTFLKYAPTKINYQKVTNVLHGISQWSMAQELSGK
jgi:hypothetical protein